MKQSRERFLNMIVGITGGSGAGKSTVSQAFKNKGFVIADGDKISHEILMPDGVAYKEVVDAFGSMYLNADKTVNRKKLGKTVFSNPDSLKKLNKIMHFHITEIVKSIIKENKNVVIDGAALIESKITDLCDDVIYVYCPSEIRIKRIMERDSISYQDACLRINSQNSDDFYRKHCTYEIVNDGNADTLKQVEEFLNCSSL